jgi:hypothetical protein
VEAGSPRLSIASSGSAADLRRSIASADLEEASASLAIKESKPQALEKDKGGERAWGSLGLFRRCLPSKKEGTPPHSSDGAPAHSPDEPTDEDDEDDPFAGDAEDDPFGGDAADAPATLRTADPTPAPKEEAPAPILYSYKSSITPQPEAKPAESPGPPLIRCLKCFRKEPPVVGEPTAPPLSGHLLFSESNGGSFQLQWSAEAVEGALARFIPGIAVPDFKLTANGGRSELCRGVGGPNVKEFYRGWVSYIRLAHQYEAKLCFLANLEKQPVALYLATRGLSVQRLREGETISLDGVRAVAAVALYATGLDVLNMETQLFLSIGQKLGSSMALEGGAAGVGGVADALVELSSENSRRVSSAEEQVAAERALSGPEREHVQLSPRNSRRLSQGEQERAAARAAEAELRAQEKAEQAARASLLLPGSSLASPRSQDSTPGVSPVSARNLSLHGVSPRNGSPLVISPRFSSARNSLCSVDELQSLKAGMESTREAAALKEEEERCAAKTARAEQLAQEQALLAQEEAAAQRAAAAAAAREEKAQYVQGILDWLKCVPKQPPAVEEAPQPPRAFLNFCEANGGCFELQWSRSLVDGALACFLPRDPVLESKLTTNGGRTELCRGIGGPDVKAFYRGWVSFVKLAHRHAATFRFLSNLEKQPVALFFATGGLAVQRLAEGETITFEGVRAVAAVGLNADGLNVRTMETQLFIQVGLRLGFSLALKGGAAGVGGVADDRVELNTDRSKMPSLAPPRQRSLAAEEEAPAEAVEEAPPQPWWSGIVPSWLKPGSDPVPPPPLLPMGHLVFSNTNGGCFQLQWSTEHVDGALARFLPKIPVPEFKLSANGGRSELCRAIGGPNFQSFCRGWISYITLARKYEASFTFLSNLDKQPVALYFATGGLSVTRLAEGETIPFDGVRAVAVVGLNAVGLNVRTMESQFFCQIGAKLGASASFVEAAPALDSPRLRVVPRTPSERSPSPDPRRNSTAIERAEERMRV